jgi:hypothetical protein
MSQRNDNNSLYYVEPLVIINTSNATGITTGACIIYGGLSASGNTYIGGNAVISGGLTAGSFNVNNLQATNITTTNLRAGSATLGSLNVTGASTLSGNLTVNGPGLRIPTGNIATRPAVPEAGHVRYNTETSQFEGYGPGSAWGSLGGVVDIAQTTKILASATPSTTDGNLYFYTVGSERMRVNSEGNVGIGTSNASYKLDIAGTLRANGGDITVGTLNLTSTNIALGANTASMSAQGTDGIAIGNNAGLSGQLDFAIAIGSNAGVDTQQANTVAIGNQAGYEGQNASSVAIGYHAGNLYQGGDSIAMGTSAGNYYQQGLAIAVGSAAGSYWQGYQSIAMGNGAGNNWQGNSAVAVGTNAGNNSQGSNAVAMGNAAGNLTQGTDAIAIGSAAGNSWQGESAVAIGKQAGNTSQGNFAVAVGYVAGYDGQGLSAVAIGNNAGTTSQGNSAVAVGFAAGQISQGSSSVAVGNNSGQNYQGLNAVAIGNIAGQNSQGSNAVAIGSNAGTTNQNTNAIAIGINAGTTNQGAAATAIGINAGTTNQGAAATAIGVNAGSNSQGTFAVAVGSSAGNSFQSAWAVAIGRNSGNTSQGSQAVAIGSAAGQTLQGGQAVAIGGNTGTTSQGASSVAIGPNCATNAQGSASVAVGTNSGNYQGTYATAIGPLAGSVSQGNYAVAIGTEAGRTSQHTNSIVINANSSALNSATAGAFYVSSVRNVTQANLLAYDTTLKEITYFSLSNFTTSNLVATNISTSTLIATSGSFGTVSSTLISGTTYTGANMSLSGNLNVGGTLTVVNITSTNLVETNITAGSILATTLRAGDITTGNISINIDGYGINFSSGKIIKQSGDGMYIIPPTDGNLGDSVGGIKFRNAANGSTAMQIFGNGTLRVTTAISSASLFGANSTITNMVATTLTSGAMVITGGSLNATFNSNIIGNIFTTGGNVGIGQGNPSSTLSIFNGGMNVGGVNSIITQGAHIQWNRSAGEGESWIINQKGMGGVSSGIRFGTSNTTNNVIEWMRIIDNGNVGINNTSPTYKLDITGTLRATGGDITTATLLATTSLSAPGNSNTVGSIFTTGGNVGVGTVVPSAKLDVAGTLRAGGEITAAGDGTGISFYLGRIYKAGGAGLRIVAGNGDTVFTNTGNNFTTMSIAEDGVLSVTTRVTSANMAAGSITSGTLRVNTVNMTPSVGDIASELTFTAGNGVTSASNITGLSFSNAIVRGFNALLTSTVVRTTGGNLYANYELKGVQQANGWILNSSFIGDNTGVTFSINTSGNVQYTSTSLANFTSNTLKFKANTTSI